MSYHIVSIDSPQCSLSCKDGQLTCKTADGEKKLPLEDVASIIITSFSATIHSNLFLTRQGLSRNYAKLCEFHDDFDGVMVGWRVLHCNWG
jgi:hypothetical protein